MCPERAVCEVQWGPPKFGEAQKVDCLKENCKEGAEPAQERRCRSFGPSGAVQVEPHLPFGAHILLTWNYRT